MCVSSNLQIISHPPSPPQSLSPQSEFEKFGEIVSASISQGIRKKFPKKKPAPEKKEENGEDKKEEAAEGEKKEEAAADGEKKEEEATEKNDDSAVVTDDEGEKKEAAAGKLKTIFNHYSYFFTLFFKTNAHISPCHHISSPRKAQGRRNSRFPRLWLHQLHHS